MPTPPDNKVKSYSHFAAHCSVTAKAQGKFTRHQNVERYGAHSYRVGDR
jgi:hypothetical protein